jgi:hypothetical protein
MGVAPVSGSAWNSHESWKVIASFWQVISDDPRALGTIRHEAELVSVLALLLSEQAM